MTTYIAINDDNQAQDLLSRYQTSMVKLPDDIFKVPSDGYINRGWLNINAMGRLVADPQPFYKKDKGVPVTNTSTDPLENDGYIYTANVICQADVYYDKQDGNKRKARHVNLLLEFKAKGAKISIQSAHKGDMIAFQGDVCKANDQTIFVRVTDFVVNHTNSIRKLAQNSKNVNQKAKYTTLEEVLSDKDKLTVDELKYWLDQIQNNPVHSDTNAKMESSSSSSFSNNNFSKEEYVPKVHSENAKSYREFTDSLAQERVSNNRLEDAFQNVINH